MARGSAIVINADARGNWEEGKVTDTSLPGTFMEIVPATNPEAGRFSWRARSLANGAIGPVVILVNDWEQGHVATLAVVANTGGHKLYWPLPGDELNALVAESTGTGTSGENAIGDRLSINTSGRLMAGGALATRPFWLLDRTGLETYTTALKWVKFLGCTA